MAVHLFASLSEIRDASTEEEKKESKVKVPSESWDLDIHIRNSLKHLDAVGRRKAFLDLEF